MNFTKWSEIELRPPYPAFDLQVGPLDFLAVWGRWCPDKALKIKADFDTGSDAKLFVDLEDLKEMAWFKEPPPIQRPPVQGLAHLGCQILYLPYSLSVRIQDSKGRSKIKAMICFCVINWNTSCLTKVNPNRQAFAGRDLMIEFPFDITLKGKTRVTTINDL